jgi:hypothetical protein
MAETCLDSSLYCAYKLRLMLYCKQVGSRDMKARCDWRDPDRTFRGSSVAAAMTALVGLGPLLKPRALWRISLRHQPPVRVRLVALRMCMNDQDRSHAAAAAPAAAVARGEDSRFEPVFASAS